MARLGEYVRKRREELGLSLTQVQLKSGGAVNSSTLSKIENGKRNAGPEILMALAPVLRVDVEQLYALAGYLPKGRAVEPETPKPFDTWEAIEDAVKQNRDLNAEQKRGLLVVMKPIVTPLLDEAKKTKREDRRAG